jgi:hypothetical protein
MNIDYSKCSLEELGQLFEKVEQELQRAMLSGADWTEVQDKRALISEVAKYLFGQWRPLRGGKSC